MSIFDQLSSADGRPSPAPADEAGRPLCSRKGCRADAGWRLLWNNPRIHTPDRRKSWLACSEHRDWLQDYLQTRGLWKETLPLADGQAD